MLLKYRDDVKRLGHDEVVRHLGVTKTKGRILRHFFWPNIYIEIEDYVKSCDLCQRVYKSKDRIEAPLKLVPVISVVFTKISIDTVGPLSKS